MDTKAVFVPSPGYLCAFLSPNLDELVGLVSGGQVVVLLGHHRLVVHVGLALVTLGKNYVYEKTLRQSSGIF